MVESTVKTYQYDNGEIQRVQVVTADSFDNLNFLFPEESPQAFGKIVNLYKNYIIPGCPWIFGRMILYYVPTATLMKEIMGIIGNDCRMTDEARLCSFLRDNVRVKKSNLVFKNQQAKDVCEKLIDNGYFEIVRGKLPHTKILPVGNSLGFLSESMPSAKMKVNSHFFIMDCFDVASIFDRIGNPIGLMVKDGSIIYPPLYDREAFLVMDDGSVEIRKVELNELTIVVKTADCGEKNLTSNKVKIYDRLTTCRVPLNIKLFGYKYLVITGSKVVGVYNRGGIVVPGSGFVIRVPAGEASGICVGDTVTYKGFENVRFGVQVGNSIMLDGRKTEEFVSKFYNIYRRFGFKAFPPSLYPLDFNKARAARIALGETRDNKACIFWAEGAKKTGYVLGEQSRGATLYDMATIAEDLGLINAVNLDGGGSAQILIDNKRELMISDREPYEDADAERGIPVGIYI